MDRVTDTVVVCGSLAQRPLAGGHAWVFLQYLLGFRELGYDVVFIDHLPEIASSDASGKPCAAAESAGVAALASVMAHHRVPWCLMFDDGSTAGMPLEEAIDHVKRSRLLVNVMGYIRNPVVLEAARRSVFLDIDPGFGQMWADLGWHNMFTDHDHYVTIGENIGSPGCPIPSGGVQWLTTKQPVVLSAWPADHPFEPPGPMTSIASWRGPFDPIEYQGTTYGLRVHEFRKFLAFARLSPLRVELALDIHPAETADIQALDDHGWERVPPSSVGATPSSYQQYIQHSAAEFMVAKGLYVETRGGWFSDRSICYLASGRPVVAQDTGLNDLLPTDAGLLTFNTLDEALSQTSSIVTDYQRHSVAARRVAEEHFDSTKVLSRLLELVN